MGLTFLSKSDDSAEARTPTVSLRAFLTRLIWLCVLPLILLAMYFAAYYVNSLQTRRDREATERAHYIMTAIDRHIGAQIAALQMLAASPLLDDPSLFKEFYREAQGFRGSFNGHVILADLSLQMLINTRAPFGEPLPQLPRPKGHAAAPLALATGKPAVGDMFLGPIAKEPLVAVAIPVIRNNRTKYLLLSTIGTHHLQQHLDETALPAGWTVTVLDGKNDVMVRRGLAQLKGRTTREESPGQFVARSAVAHWSVLLGISRNAYYAPLVATTAALAAAILAVSLLSILCGRRAARRLSLSVASLTEEMPTSAPEPDIAEIVEVRRQLHKAAAARQAAETTGMESEMRYCRLFENAPVPLCFVNSNGVLVDFNARFQKTFGYSHEDLPTLAEWWQLAYPDGNYRIQVLDTWNAAVCKASTSGEDIEPIEYRVTCKNGEVRTVLISGITIGDDFLATFFDVTERRQAEEALRESEASLRQAQQLAKVGNWSWDIKNDRHFWAEEIYRIYGRDPNLPPATYPDVARYFTPEGWTSLSAAVEQGLATGAPYECDAEVSHSNGKPCWIVARGHAEMDDSGTVVRLYGTVQDITERKMAEEEIRRLNAGLEKRVEERTADLYAANRELDAFAYAVSHDLRAPLRAMIGFSQALFEDLKGKLENESRENLDEIILASRNMSALIDGLLTLSRSTKGELSRESVDLGAIAARIRSDLEQSEPGRRPEWSIESEVRADGDSRMLEVVMRNLVGNAWKYTTTTTAPRISFYSETRDGQRYFCIADNGAGFDMRHADKLFKPFQRLHRQDEFPGIGIGLATVQRIIHRHGGIIAATAEPGKGAIFRFTLP